LRDPEYILDPVIEVTCNPLSDDIASFIRLDEGLVVVDVRNIKKGLSVDYNKWIGSSVQTLGGQHSLFSLRWYVRKVTPGSGLMKIFIMMYPCRWRQFKDFRKRAEPRLYAGE
jgi:hypothetical protein